MRRLSLVIKSGLLLAAGINLLLAQHSGGGHSGHGGSSGFSHGVSSGFSHSGPSRTTNSTLSSHSPSAGQLIYPTNIGLQTQYSGYTGINRGALSNGSRRGSVGGRGYYGGGYFLSPYYYSTFDDYDTPYAYNQAVEDPAAQTANVTANLLGQQIAQLSAEVDALRNDRESENAGEAVRPRYHAPPAMAEDDAPSTPPVTLVLRSGKQVQLKSYAVMGQDIWDFSVQPAKRIALANVDLGASKRVTEGNGGEFPEIR